MRRQLPIIGTIDVEMEGVKIRISRGAGGTTLEKVLRALRATA
jgi:hypothetical protein